MSCAGRRKSGPSARQARVSGHDSDVIAARRRTSETTLLTTPDSVEVNACCAPITSVLRRLTSAPVWVRVKKAIGWASTCEKTWLRRS